MEKRKEFEIPSHIIDKFLKDQNQYPCIVETKKIIKEGIDKILEKNKIIWFNYYFDGEIKIHNEGLIIYGTNQTMIYYHKDKNDTSYKLFLLTTTNNEEKVYMFIKGLNKFFTIDKI